MQGHDYTNMEQTVCVCGTWHQWILVLCTAFIVSMHFQHCDPSQTIKAKDYQFGSDQGNTKQLLIVQKQTQTNTFEWSRKSFYYFCWYTCRWENKHCGESEWSCRNRWLWGSCWRHRQFYSTVDSRIFGATVAFEAPYFQENDCTIYLHLFSNACKTHGFFPWVDV